MNVLQQFMQKIQEFGLEYFGRFYANYRGVVFDNVDPENRGRIWVKVPAVAGEDVLATMAYPIAPYAGKNYGFFFPPEKDDTVIVCFENGDPSFPMYMGGWWKTADMEAEGDETNPAESGMKEFKQDAETENPKRRGIKTPAGHMVLFDDTEGTEILKIHHAKGTFIEVKETGSMTIEIRTAPGEDPTHKVFIDTEEEAMTIEDKHVNKIVLNAEGLKIETKHAQIVELFDKLIHMVTTDKFHIEGKELVGDWDKGTVGKGAAEAMVLGNKLETYIKKMIDSFLKTHVHPTAMGPSGPPAAPPPPWESPILSTKFKVL